jgi:hypothetical protein
MTTLRCSLWKKGLPAANRRKGFSGWARIWHCSQLAMLKDCVESLRMYNFDMSWSDGGAVDRKSCILKTSARRSPPDAIVRKQIQQVEVSKFQRLIHSPVNKSIEAR